MSARDLHLSLCRRLSGELDPNILLPAAVEDVRESLSLASIQLRVGSDSYGQSPPSGVQSETREIAGFGQLEVGLPDGGLGKADWDLAISHLEVCVHLSSVSDEMQHKRLLKESQAQLVHSSKMAAVGQLAAGVAHELNSPLGAVMLQLDAASLNLERERYKKAADRLDSAEKAATAAKEIISKLLFYSRDATKGLRNVNLNEVISDTLALLGKQLSYDNLLLDIQPGQIDLVTANQNELQQVVTNLLLNAKDAVLEDGAVDTSLEVVTYQNEAGVHLEVRDRGPGISDEVRGKIFDPFFTTKPVGRGTGLGLSVSHQIIKQHGGKLEAENRPDGGAIFRITLEGKNG
jgi:C4-dicarboxylate-specific signal transduction histidine kinase